MCFGFIKKNSTKKIENFKEKSLHPKNRKFILKCLTFQHKK